MRCSVELQYYGRWLCFEGDLWCFISSLVFSHLLCMCLSVTAAPTHCPSVARGGTAPWRPDSEQLFIMWKDAVCCWVTEREDEIQDRTAERERERRWNRCCIHLPVFMHSEFTTARSLEILSYFYSVFGIRILSICVPLFFPGEKLFLCRHMVVCHSCSTSPHTQTHTVGGRGATLWSVLHSLQLSWCRLTDLYRQEREIKIEVEEVERCIFPVSQKYQVSAVSQCLLLWNHNITSQMTSRPCM